MVSKIVIILLILLLAGCTAIATTYQPYSSVYETENGLYCLQFTTTTNITCIFCEAIGRGGLSCDWESEQE